MRCPKRECLQGLSLDQFILDIILNEWENTQCLEYEVDVVINDKTLGGSRVTTSQKATNTVQDNATITK